jgi:adenylate cyclase, class 2
MRFPGKTPHRTAKQVSSKTPGEEVEVKLRVADRKALVRQLVRLKAKPAGPRTHEMNTLYDTPGGALSRRRQLLRIRIERPANRAGKGRHQRATAPTALLTFKGPPRPHVSRGSSEGRRYKVREEHEVRVYDGKAMARTLEALGLRPWFRYEKYRSVYHLPGLAAVAVDLDETPIGVFIELEGDRAAIDRSAALLGFEPSEYITKSYGALYLEHCRIGRPPGAQGEPSPASGLPDMLFSRRK